MDLDYFEYHFQRAVLSQTESYKESRAAILEMGQAAIPRLQEKVQKETDWRSTLTAEILLGWLTDESLYKECHELVKGNWSMEELPVTGEPDAYVRSWVIYSRGEKILPRLLEMLIKTKEYTNQEEMGAIADALSRFSDPKAILPMMEVVEDDKEDEYLRVSLLWALGQFDDNEAKEFILKILLDKENSDQLRGTAGKILSIPFPKEERAFEPLIEIVLDNKSSQGLKLSALLALRYFGDERVLNTLYKLLPIEKDKDLLRVIIATIGDLGNLSSIEILDEAYKTIEDEGIREQIEYAKEQINSLYQK